MTKNRRLVELYTTVDEIEVSPEERAQIAYYMVGWLSGCVSDDEWAAAVDGALAMTRRSRQTVVR